MFLHLLAFVLADMFFDFGDAIPIKLVSRGLELGACIMRKVIYHQVYTGQIAFDFCLHLCCRFHLVIIGATQAVKLQFVVLVDNRLTLLDENLIARDDLTDAPQILYVFSNGSRTFQVAGRLGYGRLLILFP